MLYEEYEEFKRQYKETQRKYNDILSEKEKLFQITQPQAVNTDQEKVSGGNPKNNFDQYLILKEQQRIDERLAEVKALLMDRAELLKLKKEELRQSQEPEDMVYRLRYIERMRVYKIAKAVNYSEAQVYRILRIIRSRLKDDRK